MDDATSRTRSTNRRMATAKAGGTTKRSSPSRGSKKSPEPEVSPARWAGVALVIAAIVGAIFLAMISPSEPGEPSQPGPVAENADPTPSAAPATLDVAIPVAQPAITLPENRTSTPEIEIAVTVDVPDDTTVPRKHLDLHVHGGTEIRTVEKPKPGTAVTVEGVRLMPGENTLTAVLGSPAGPGPVSDPVVVILDETKAKVGIVSPKNKTQTYDAVIPVDFVSETNATVRIVNEANSFDDKVVIGPSGEASLLVRLKRGKNRIVATSFDQAGQEQTDSITVTRIDGRPRVKLKYPEIVDPPKDVRIIAIVEDFEGEPMADAEVHFSLGGTGRTTETEIGYTNENGRAAWNTQVATSTSPATTIELGVIVISPTGDKETLDHTITLR